VASKFLENNFVNKKFKIGSLIAIQILIILGSFIVISQFTIQSEYLGNTINLSGSNRFLGELLFETTENFVSRAPQNNPMNIVNTIDENMYLLKNGREHMEIFSTDGESNPDFNHLKIMPIPSSVASEFNKLQLGWQEYKSELLKIMSSNQKQSLYENPEFLTLKAEFIEDADLLTLGLSNFSTQTTINLYFIQILLLFVNLGAHLFLLFVIIKIITKEEKTLTKTKSLEVKNENLVEELTSVLMKKNSIQLTSSLLLHELQETEKLTGVHEFVSEKDKVKYFWDNFYKNILNHVEDLEKSRKKYDDEKSYYEQLNQRFKHGINLLDGKNKTITKNSDLSDSTLDDLRDFINSLSESGMISPENNRILTNVLNDIIDSKLRQNSKHT
jgi:hypothetical protein